MERVVQRGSDGQEAQQAGTGVLAAPGEGAWEVAVSERAARADAGVMAVDGVVVMGTADGETSEPAAEIDRPAVERKQAIGSAALDRVLANVYHDPTRQTVTLLLDERYASVVIYAVRALAAEYEAHAREIRVVAASLPPDSYGALNRYFIAIRHERIAARLRTVESNYRAEVG